MNYKRAFTFIQNLNNKFHYILIFRISLGINNFIVYKSFITNYNSNFILFSYYYLRSVENRQAVYGLNYLIKVRKLRKSYNRRGFGRNGINF